MFNHILKFIIIFIIANSQTLILPSANIEWEVQFKSDKLFPEGFYSKMIKDNDKLLVVFTGRNPKNGQRNLGIFELDLEGNIIRKKEYPNEKNLVLQGFQKYGSNIQIFSVHNDSEIGWDFVGSGHPFLTYLDEDLEIEVEYIDTSFNTSGASMFFFEKDTIKKWGSFFHNYYGHLEIWDNKAKYAGGYTLDTTGFNADARPRNYSTIKLQDNNLLWHFDTRKQNNMTDKLLVKTDQFNNRIWLIQIDQISEPEHLHLIVHNILEDLNGNINVFGRIAKEDFNEEKWIYIKFDSLGNYLLHNLIYPEEFEFYPLTFKSLSNGNMAFGGIERLGARNRNFYVYFVNTKGEVIDKLTWKIEDENIPVEIVEKDNGNLIYFGYVRKHINDDDYIEDLYLAEISYLPTSVDEKTKNLVEPLLIYPNPAKDHIKVNTRIISRGEVRIYNSFGLELYYNQLLPDTSPHIDISSLPAGLYTVVLESGSEVKTGIFVVVR